MNNDELISFNPILAEAVARAERGNNWAGAGDYLRELVASSVRSGVSADVIYAMIKTGRILTSDNMKLLTDADLEEWEDARDEYNRQANTKSHVAKEGKAMAKAKTYQLTIEVEVKNERQAIELARKLYADNPAEEPIDDDSDEMRLIPPEEFIEDVQDALMLLFEANPLFERAGAEVISLSTPAESDSN